MAQLGRLQPQTLQPLRTPLPSLNWLAGATTGAVTMAGSVTAARADVGATTGAVTMSGTITAGAAFPADVTGAVTMSGTVAGLASIPAYPIRRGPFGRT